MSLPLTYNNDKPKPSVTVNITVLDILDVNIQKSTFDIYFVQEAYWYDTELSFLFLRDENVENILHHIEDRNKIWSPEIKYIHLEKMIVIEEKYYIRKEPNYEASVNPRHILNMTEFYNGTQHPIVIEKKMRNKFVCHFDQSNYPFGYQECSMRFYLAGSAKQLTRLQGHLQVSDRSIQKAIGQYNVQSWRLHEEEEEDAHTNHTTITVTVTLTRDMTVTILVTHLPTLLMNLINQATNYISGDSRYEFIITVNITCMMVLASIYLSVSTSLPNTPSIKPVEIWLLASFIYPFMVITVNIALQVTSFTA